jgi:hypothetical protein
LERTLVYSVGREKKNLEDKKLHGKRSYVQNLRHPSQHTTAKAHLESKPN